MSITENMLYQLCHVSLKINEAKAFTFTLTCLMYICHKKSSKKSRDVSQVTEVSILSITKFRIICRIESLGLARVT